MNRVENFQQILKKEMSRKEFLQHIGIFIIGAMGITAVMNHFLKLSGYQPDKKEASRQNNGYGVRPYGR